MKEVCDELQAELKLAQGATQHHVDNVRIHHHHVEQVVKDILKPPGGGVRRGQMI